MVVVDNRNKPGGRWPLSTTSSHSKPNTPLGNIAVCPSDSESSPVFRQNLSLPSFDDTRIGSFRNALTVKSCPVRAFSGRPPSAGGLNRGSRHVPVHAGLGSIFAFACVSL